MFVPFFAALYTEWAAALALPLLLSLPLVCVHRWKFNKAFPGAKNIEDFRKTGKLVGGCTVEELEAAWTIEKFGEGCLLVWEQV